MFLFIETFLFYFLFFPALMATVDRAGFALVSWCENSISINHCPYKWIETVVAM